MKKRIVFKIKTGYKLELLSPETMKSLRSAKEDLDKGKDGENVPKLESVEVDLVLCKLVNNSQQQESKVLLTFVPNKQFGQLIIISTHSLTMLKNTSAEFQSIQLWFTDQNNRTLEIEHNTNNWVDIIKMTYSTGSKDRKYVKGYRFLSFARKLGDKYSENVMDIIIKTGIDAAKTASD